MLPPFLPSGRLLVLGIVHADVRVNLVHRRNESRGYVTAHIGGKAASGQQSVGALAALARFGESCEVGPALHQQALGCARIGASLGKQMVRARILRPDGFLTIQQHLGHDVSVDALERELTPERLLAARPGTIPRFHPCLGK
jgi:hypothetical protein